MLGGGEIEGKFLRGLWRPFIKEKVCFTSWKNGFFDTRFYFDWLVINFSICVISAPTQRLPNITFIRDQRSVHCTAPYCEGILGGGGTVGESQK